MVTLRDQEVATAAITRFREIALEPAGLAPLGVASGPIEARGDGLVGVASLARPEAAPWNRWGPDGRPLLFNDRAALLVDVRIEAEGPIAWDPDRTRLEVNRPDQVVAPAPSAEHLLADLAWHALEQERWLLDGDLVQRTRYAGGFRDVFVRADGAVLHGVIPFALPDPEVHVAALRLTVGVTVGGVPAELVWVFQ